MLQHRVRFSASKERRAAVRYPCPGDTTCAVRDSRRDRHFPAGVWNISLSGVCLLLKPTFTPGSLLTVELGSQAQAFRCHLPVEVRHSDICFPNDAWLLGCAFARPLRLDDLLALGVPAAPPRVVR
jgi:hypothetical protein